jgi:hypothetical protein
LSHELTHFTQEAYEKDCDPKHERKAYWGRSISIQREDTCTQCPQIIEQFKWRCTSDIKYGPTKVEEESK